MLLPMLSQTLTQDTVEAPLDKLRPEAHSRADLSIRQATLHPQEEYFAVDPAESIQGILKL